MPNLKSETSEMEAVIKRLMKYCGRANKEVTQSIERRKLVMDIEMIYSGLMEIMEQRDAALKLADKWANRADKELGGEVHGEHEIRIDEDACCADELRAIFEEKP